MKIDLNKNNDIITAKVYFLDKEINQFKVKAAKLAQTFKNPNIKKVDREERYFEILMFYETFLRLFMYLNKEKLKNQFITVITNAKIVCSPDKNFFELAYYPGPEIHELKSKLSKELFLKYFLGEDTATQKLRTKQIKEFLVDFLSEDESFYIFSRDVIIPALIELNDVAFSLEYKKLIYKNYKINFKQAKVDTSFVPEKQREQVAVNAVYLRYLWFTIIQLDKHYFSNITKADFVKFDNDLLMLLNNSLLENVLFIANYLYIMLMDIRKYRDIATFYEECIPQEFLDNPKDYEEYGSDAWWFIIQDKTERSKGRGTGFGDQMRDGMELWYQTTFGKKMEILDIKEYDRLFERYMNEWNRIALKYNT